MTSFVVIPPQNKVVGGFIGFTPSVRPSCILCPLCSAYSSGWIHFILIQCTSYHATSESVLRVMFLAKFKNLNFWQIFKICNFVLLWLGIWCESLVWVIMRQQGVSQNAGILVVLVSSKFHWSFVPKCPIDNNPALVQILKPQFSSMVSLLISRFNYNSSGNRSCRNQNLISVCTLKQSSRDTSCGLINTNRTEICLDQNGNTLQCINIS